MNKLKKGVRNVIVARNSLSKMGNHTDFSNPFEVKYLNDMASEVMKLAGSVHYLLPYYLAIKAI